MDPSERDQAPSETPSANAAKVFSAIFFVTAAVLAFIGYALDPGAASDMQGFQRLLFTFVSIRWFSWLFAVVFAVMGFRILKSNPNEESGAGD